MNHLKLIIPVVLVSMAAGFFGGALSVKYYAFDFDRNDGENITPAVVKVVEESELTDAIEEVAPSVVSIVALKDVPVGGGQVHLQGPYSFFFQQPQNSVEYEYQEVSGGTGFIVNVDGLILTNRHVVQDEEADYRVVLNDGKEYEAEVVSRDPFDDIAVVKIVMTEGEKADFEYVEFGDSDDLKVGQTVVAIGNALAEYDNTATEGIISAKGRDVAAYNEGAGLTQNLSGLLQTDAAINFGNSGGPLVNLEGQVIGMNTAVANAANGIGFAIPSNDLAPILASVQEYGKIVRPVMGVRFLMLDEKQAQEISEELDRGALLIADELAGLDSIIEGGAADEAGLQDLDVILQIDDQVIDSENPLHTVVRNYAPGDTIKVKVWRDGEELEFDVTLKSSEELAE